MQEPKKNDKVIEDNETETIKAIKEGYEKKIQELEEKHKQDLVEQEKKLEKKHAEQIRALFLEGSPSQAKEPKKVEDNEKTFYERVEEKMKQKLKI